MSVTPIILPEFVDGDLRLRPPCESDVPAIVRLCSDPDVQRFTRVPSPYTEDHARDFLSLHAARIDAGTGVHLLAVDATTDEVLGAVGGDIDHRDYSAEVGYWVGAEVRGRGIATRGTRMLVRSFLEDLDVQYLLLHAAVDNPASNAVARKLGFTHEGTSRDAMLLGPTGDVSSPRGDANLWGLRPGELT